MSSLQVQIGKQGVVNLKAIEDVNSYEALAVGNFVVVNLADCEEGDEPYIGKVTEVKESTVDIVWMRGSYTRPWKEYTTGAGRNLKQRMDTIPIQSILMFGFTLTDKGYLKKQTVSKIKDLYRDL